jgi:hypothetical protein
MKKRLRLEKRQKGQNKKTSRRKTNGRVELFAEKENPKGCSFAWKHKKQKSSSAVLRAQVLFKKKIALIFDLFFQWFRFFLTASGLCVFALRFGIGLFFDEEDFLVELFFFVCFSSFLLACFERASSFFARALFLCLFFPSLNRNP